MKKLSILISSALITLLSCTLYAQPISPQAHQQLNSISQSIANTPPGLRLQALSKQSNQLNQLSSSVPGLKLVATTAISANNSKTATDQLIDTYQKIQKTRGALNKSDAIKSATKILKAMYTLQKDLPNLPKNDKKAHQALQNLLKSGIDMGKILKQTLGGKSKKFLDFVEKLEKFADTLKSNDQLSEEGEKNIKDFIDHVLSGLPPAIGGGLSTPANVYFRDLMVYNTKMWDASTQGLNVVADAIANGKVDTQKLRQITDRINQLAKDGPWKNSARDFLEKIAEKFPILKELLDKLWPKEKSKKGCGAINCDCDNLKFGIITGPYRQECRRTEKALKAHCAKTGKIEGKCHATASGPNPNPK